MVAWWLLDGNVGDVLWWCGVMWWLLDGNVGKGKVMIDSGGNMTVVKTGDVLEILEG